MSSKIPLSQISESNKIKNVIDIVANMSNGSLAHSHNDIYYTKQEADNKIALSSAPMASAAHVKNIAVTLEEEKWNSTWNTYSIKNSNIKETSVVILTLKNGTTTNVYNVFSNAKIVCQGQSNGEIVLAALGVMPEQSIDINLAIFN